MQEFDRADGVVCEERAAHERHVRFAMCLDFADVGSGAGSGLFVCLVVE